MMSYINETDFVIENKELVYPEIVTDGLQLYYDAKGKRDTDYHRDTMLDMSGNKNHGKLYNFAYEKHSGYKDGLVFDYVDDKLVRPELDLNPNDFTFMLNGNIISFSPDGTVKRVQDGQVIESKGFNLVRNGDFSDGINRWDNVAGRYTVLGYKDGGVTLRTDTSSARLEYNLMANKTDIYYCTVEVESDGTNVFLGSQAGVLAPYSNKPNRQKLSYLGVINYVRLSLGASNVGTISTFYKPMAINLTETFGAGNEPTKEQMDEIINRFGFIPNAQDLIDRIEYKGNDLGDMENIIDGLYKTDVLSGEEIYTDEADDSVVHVGVDGNSVGGGENNLISKSDIEFWNGVSSWKNDIVTIQTTGSAGVRIPSSVFEINQKHTFSFKARLISGTVYGIMGHAQVFDAFGYQNGNSLGSWTGSVTSAQEELVIGKEYNYKINLTKTRDGDWLYIQPNRSAYSTSYKIELYDFQLNKGDNTDKYNGLKPTPDYPNEIHSLNDFDVVSSVGRENLLKNSGDFINTNHWGSYTSISSYEIVEKRMIIKAGDSGSPRLVNGTLIPLNSESQEFIISVEYIGDVNVRVVGKTSNSATDRNEGGAQNVGSLNLLREIDLGSGRKRVIYKWDTLVETETVKASWLMLSIPVSSTVELINMKVERGNIQTPWAPELETVAENFNHPLIDKINLLLDEPLRSVGGVKDRLFRDNDGLWKVERSVWTEILDKNTELNSSGASSYEGALSTNRYIKPSKNSYGHAGLNVELCSHLPHKDYVWTDDNLLFGTSINGRTQFHFRLPNTIIGVTSGDGVLTRSNKILDWFESEKNNGNPFIVQYRLVKPEIETLDQELQDKLNNIRSFQDSNYIYTALPNENNTLSENLKPTLHAKFLYNNWYKEDRVINNLMIYNRALNNEEMLQNYKTIKRRWGM